MKLICPACGFGADADGFIAELDQARALAAALKVPSALAGPLMSYLRLFRPEKRHLTSRKVEKLLGELLPMIAAGRVRWKGRDWAAPLDAWVAAFEELAGRRDKLTLPLDGHGYLMAVLAGGANRTEAAAEAQTEQTRQRGQQPATPEKRDYRPVIRPQGIPEHVREHFVRAGMLPPPDQSTGDTE